MATITARTGANGVTKYKAQIRKRHKGVIVHQETETFARRAAAVAWGKKRETELSSADGMAAAKADDPTLAKAIGRYLEESRDVGTGKRQALELIAKNGLGALPCSKVTSADIVEFGQGLGRAPVTVSGYLSHLKSVFKVAKPAWRYPLDKAVIVEALDVLHELKVTGTSKRRERRPTLDEITRIVEHQYKRWSNNPRMAPYHLITMFALFSTRRQAEITRMKFRDVDAAGCTLMVYDMKDPRHKKGNNVRVDLPYEAIRIIRAARRIVGGEVVFPIAAITVSTEFKETVDALGIEDLRFHDLRHEGTSRLFELSHDIPRVAKVTGHKSWLHLQRYTHIEVYGDKYRGWPWLDLVAPLPQSAQ